MPRVKEFKYLGSTVQENGGCEREVKEDSAGRMKWMEKSIRSNLRQDVIPARVKGKVYSLVIRPATVYGLETMAVTTKWKRWKSQR